MVQGRENARAKSGRSGRADDDDEFVGGKLSQQILSQARKQLEELEEENMDTGVKKKKAPKVDLGQPALATGSDSEEDVENDDDEDTDGADFATDMHINQKDEAAFARFMAPSDGPKRNLADIIREKINEKRTEIDTQYTDAGSMAAKEFDPETIEMYEGVGKVLASYRSGKVPKAFKVIPQFRHWEDLIMLTKPDQWSAAAMFRATKIFVANLKESMAQRFFNYILLPRVRDDIDTYQRLNFHLYQALRKALFKPGAFFKGFLIPLCEAGDCTLREAIIIGSVLAKNSIPILHSCACMLKIAEMEYSGANSIFLRIFLDKKYALPYRVVDAVAYTKRHLAV